MSNKRRLDRLEVRAPVKQGIPKEPPPDAIELLAEEVIQQLKDGTAERKSRRVVPELLRSKHVPEDLKDQLRAL